VFLLQFEIHAEGFVGIHKTIINRHTTDVFPSMNSLPAEDTLCSVHDSFREIQITLNVEAWVLDHSTGEIL
jgi:hypothetical protein